MQFNSQKCSQPQVIEPLTEKTWGRSSIVTSLVSRKTKSEMVKLLQEQRNLMNDVAKQLLNLAFVGYRDLALMDNTYLICRILCILLGLIQ